MARSTGSSKQFIRETEEFRSLRTLEEIERNPSVSQRELAESLGVALGIANACIHSLVRKGLVKIRGENNRSITYHLTKKGLAQKAQLAMEWTRNTVDFYREARGVVSEELAALADSGVKTVALYGTQDLAEIALIVSGDVGIDVVGVVRAPGDRERERVAGMQVRGLDLLGETRPDAVVVTTQVDADAVSDIERALGGAETLVHPIMDRGGFAESLAQARGEALPGPEDEGQE